MHVAIYVLEGHGMGHRPHNSGQLLAVNQLRKVSFHKFQDAPDDSCRSVFARHGEHSFTAHCGLEVSLPQDRVQVLLDKIGLPLFDNQHSPLTDTEALDFVVDQRIGDVEDVKRDFGIAKCVG